MVLWPRRSPSSPEIMYNVHHLWNDTGSTHNTYQDHRHVREPVVGLTDVVQSRLVQEDLLQDEGCHCLGQLRSGLHDPEAEGDDLCGQEEVDHLLFVSLDQGTDYTEAGSEKQLRDTSRETKSECSSSIPGQPEILERPRL